MSAKRSFIPSFALSIVLVAPPEPSAPAAPAVKTSAIQIDGVSISDITFDQLAAEGGSAAAAKKLLDALVSGPR